MGRKTIVLVALLGVLLLVPSFSCVPSTGNAQSSTSTLVTEIIATPTATLEPTPSPEPTEAPTPAVDEFGFSEEQRAKLNQQIQDFINKKGEFTEEKVSEELIKITLKTNKAETKLGLMDETPRLQCWLFDYFVWNNQLLLLAGFDGRDNSRFVTLLDIPIDVYAVYESGIFVFDDIAGNDFSSSGVVVDGSGDPERIIQNIENVKGNRIIFTLPYEELSQEILDESAKYGEQMYDLAIEMNCKVDLVKSLIMSVAKNGIDLRFDSFPRIQLLLIHSLDDLANIDFSKIPLLTTDIIY